MAKFKRTVGWSLPAILAIAILAPLAPVGAVPSDLAPQLLVDTPAHSYVDGPLLEISPDGQHVLFVTTRNAATGRQLYSVPIGGGDPVRLTPTGSEIGDELYWSVSQDSRSVVYAAAVASEPQAVYVVPMTGGTPNRLSPDLPDGYSASGVITPDGGTVVYEVSDSSGVCIGLYSVPVAGGSPTALIPGLPQHSCGIRISPDSSTVVATLADGSSGPFHLFSVPVAGGTVVRLTPDIPNPGLVAIYYVHITADSRYAVYRATHDQPGIEELFAVSLATGQRHKLNPDITTEDILSYEVSQDGWLVVYDNNGELFSVDIEGGETTKLTTREDFGFVHQYQISPDGRYVAFESTTPSRVYEVYAVPTAGGPSVKMGETIREAWGKANPRISADSRRVVFLHNGDGVDAVSVPIEGGPATVLSTNRLPRDRVVGIHLTPDGTRVVFEMTPSDWLPRNAFLVPISGGEPYRLNDQLGAYGTVDDIFIASNSEHAIYLVTDSPALNSALHSVRLNHAPSMAAARFSVDEDASVGESVGTVVATDNDGHPIRFDLVGGDVDVFSIDMTSGQIALESALDYESRNSHQLAVRASDTVFSQTVEILIDVIDVNEPPQAEHLTVAVPEDTGVNSIIGKLQVSDPEGDDVSLTALDPSGLFAIEPSGDVMLLGILDFETEASHIFEVEVSDGHLSIRVAVTVQVVDVDETPPSTTTTTTTTTLPPPPPEFGDVHDTSTFHNDIVWLATQGITRGCNPPVNDEFCPDQYVTRGQMAAFLHRALADTLTAGPDADFTDDDGTVFEADIEWLASVGVTQGCNPPDNTLFCPTSYVTRGQMAAFLDRALDLLEPIKPDLFTDDDESLFEAQIDRLAAAGITKGCNPPDNTLFCPDARVTRAHMAAFLHRALEAT